MKTSTPAAANGVSNVKCNMVQASASAIRQNHGRIDLGSSRTIPSDTEL